MMSLIISYGMVFFSISLYRVKSKRLWKIHFRLCTDRILVHEPVKFLSEVLVLVNADVEFSKKLFHRRRANNVWLWGGVAVHCLCTLFLLSLCLKLSVRYIC